MSSPTLGQPPMLLLSGSLSTCTGLWAMRTQFCDALSLTIPRVCRQIRTPFSVSTNISTLLKINRLGFYPDRAPGRFDLQIALRMQLNFFRRHLDKTDVRGF